jgi:hypothetical protein
MTEFQKKCAGGCALAVLAAFGTSLAAAHMPPVLQKAVSSKLPPISWTPAFDPHNFGDKIDNPFFPLKPGTVLVYSGTKDGKHVVQHMHITKQHRTIVGVNTLVIHDVTEEDGQLSEDTTDWYAQDNDGNVWYFGEQTRKLDNGKWSTEGSWMAGKEGTRPGVYMQAHPRVGDTYEQEHYGGRPGDTASVLSLDEPITVPYGSYKKSQLTMEFSGYDPGSIDAKYYVQGVGVVEEMAAKGPTEALLLDKVTSE